MNPVLNRTGIVSLSLLAFSACAQPAVEMDLVQAEQLASASAGQEITLQPQPALAASELQQILADGLSLEEALHLTLVHQKELQAKLYEVGMAQADLLQAGLLANPTLDLAIRFPGDGTGNLIDALLGFELLELWQIPLRERAADYQLQATVAEVARAAVAHLRATKLAYFEVQVQDQLFAYAEQQGKLAEEAWRAQQGLAEEGMADAAAVEMALLHVQQSRLALAGIEAARDQARQALGRALSLSQSLRQVVLADPLPPTSAFSLKPEDLVRQAMEQRLDLRALASKLSALEAELSLRHRERFGSLSAGPMWEDPGDGQNSIGPGISWTLPLFDQNQAGIAKAGFALEQARLQYQGASAQIAQDVRGAWTVHQEAEQRHQSLIQDILPVVQSMEQRIAGAVAAGMAPRTELLAIQEERLSTEAQLLKARRDLIRSHFALEWAVGAPILASSERQ